MGAGREGFKLEGRGDLLPRGYLCDAHITNYDMKGRSCPLHIVIHSHHILKIFAFIRYASASCLLVRTALLISHPQ